MEYTTTISDAVDKWFPRNPTRELSSSSLRGRFICFHGAGSDSSVFTGKGTRRRALANPLLDMCLKNNIEILSLHLPARTSRLSEPPLTRMDDVVIKVVEKLKTLVFEKDTTPVPFFFVGHSMGGIILFEVACALRALNLPLPRHLFISCSFPAHLPPHQRPWPVVQSRNSKEFLQDCLEWGINKIVLDPSIWALYEPILRADFSILDSYDITARSVQQRLQQNYKLELGDYYAPLRIPSSLAYATQDHLIPESIITRWKDVLQGDHETASSVNPCEVITIEGSHNLFYDADPRESWMNIITQRALEHLSLQTNSAS